MDAFIDDLGGFEDRDSRLNLAMKKFRWTTRDLQKQAATVGYNKEDWSVFQLRFSLGGGRSLPKYEAREWVPEALRGEGYIGEDLDGMGSLWLHWDTANSVRVGTHLFPYDGLGRFLVGIKGCNVVVLTWPSASLLELGQSSLDAVQFWEQLAQSEFDAFFKRVKHCPLLEGGAVWIPYGWSCMAAALPTKSDGALIKTVSCYLTMVHLNKKLFKHVDEASRTLITRHSILIVGLSTG